MQQPHALTITEVLLEILSNLSSKDLVASALVCQAWLAPAIDTIWRTKTILFSHLLAKLAPLTVTVPSNWFTLKWATLDSREITQEHWTFFLENYADKVTKLEIDVDIDMNSFVLLRELIKVSGGRLCSGVLTLDAIVINTSEPHSQSLFELLLGPRLLEVRLAEISSSSIVVHLLLQVQHHAPGVTKLDITSIDRSIDYSAFSRLKTLTHRGIISPAHFITLSTCRELQILHIMGLSSSTSEPASPPTSTPFVTFPSLFELQAHSCQAGVEDLIFKSTTPHLRTVDFMNTSHLLDVPALDHFLRRCHLLKDLTINVDVSSDELLKMGYRNVRRLKLIKWEFLDQGLRDDYFDWIGASYPELRELTLEVAFDIQAKSNWGILASLVPKCGYLEKLTLPLRIQTFAFSYAESLYTPPLQSLTSLRLEKLMIKTTLVEEFARYLATLCPNVHTFEVGDFYSILVSVNQDQPSLIYSDDVGRESFIRSFYQYQEDSHGDDPRELLEAQESRSRR
ncbi:hypothetical protein FRB96_007178 [Tulasnella sp. 330]|nr:hypothetical protein FRB96_007178 [Tulasnella sp. 330]KAG8879302.1 hypothetical protein FRB97_001785 [Tulasnella sp. 331]KAG8883284.1 hypothetical protein FRB98_003192 [Tulasnella sp. 332]